MSEAMDALEARAHRQLNLMRDLSDAMAAVRARETSPDGAVTVEVDGNGAPVDLAFTGRIAELSPAEFERVLVETAARAAESAFARRGKLVEDFNTVASEM